MTTQIRRPETLVDDPGVWFAIAVAVVIVTLLLAGLAGLDPTATGVAVVGVGGLLAARLRALIAAALGVVAWAFFTGFSENAFGQLTFTPADLGRLALFAAGMATLASLGRHAAGRKAVRHG